MAAIFTGIGLTGKFTVEPTPPAPPPPPPPTGYELLIVAGGGGGGAVAGWGAGGGGGGGGLRYLPSISIVPGTTYNITVGAGGALGQSGADSAFSASGIYSNYFDGNGDKLTIPANIAFGFGTGDFTVEAWVCQTARSSPVNFNHIVGTHNAGATADWVLWLSNAGAPGFYLKASGEDFSTTIVPLGIWTHVAVTRQSGTLKFWVNGLESGSIANRNSDVGQADPLGIGDAGTGNPVNFQGYISNVRIVKGTAVYTTNFTPSTSPLTATPNTVLLTCQSSTFIDNSVNNFTLTPAGDVSVSTISQASTIAVGGGGGGNFNAWNSGTVGLSGGSGGGGPGNYYGDIPGGAEIPGQGQAGGQGKGYFNNQGSYVGGGGGGAGTAGIPGVDGGHGGNGLQYWGQYYAGGGGGGVIYEYGFVYIPLGGLGGGGNGAGSNTDGGSDGAPNTGGGGGGGRTGGSGIVILRYPVSFGEAAAVTGTYTVEIQGGYRFYKFTDSGTIRF